MSYDLAASQRKNISDIAGFFWSSSFVHASDDHDYVIISQILVTGNQSQCRGSILDITNVSRYAMFESTTNDTNSVFGKTGEFDARFPDYGFSSVSSKTRNMAMRTWSSDEEVQFDLKFERSSPALLNGGLGIFQADACNPWNGVSRLALLLAGYPLMAEMSLLSLIGP